MNYNSGYVVPAVMIVMVVIFITIGGLLTHTYILETDEVNRTLSGIRAYWAMVGTLDYSLARCRQQQNPPISSCASYSELIGYNFIGSGSELNTIWSYGQDQFNVVVTPDYVSSISFSINNNPVPQLIVGLSITNGSSVINSWTRR